MALFNKINEKSGIITGVIGAALILFMLGGDIMSNNSIFNMGKNRVGKINGEGINLPEYQNMVAMQEYEYQIQTDRSVSEEDRPSIQNQAWNELVNRFAFEPEYDKLGIKVTKEEIIDMVQGKFIHAQIKSAFGNPQSGVEFDKETVVNFLANFDQVQPSIQQRWKMIESKLPTIRLKEKYNNLLKKSEYVTSLEAKQTYAEQNDKAELNYISVPYTTLDDSTIKVNDDQLEDYIKKNKDKYKVEAGKTFDYVVFEFTPSGEDSAAIMTEVAELAASFKTTENDSVFIGANSDSPADPTFMGIGELPENLKAIGALSKDTVYGPFLSNGKYALFKVLDTKNDTVSSIKASHILFRIDEDKAAAKVKALEVLSQIKQGASFESMAMEHGTDGTASKGGDLGWFSNNGQMVKPFEDACFKFNGKGLIPTLVETQFGYHIIKVTEPKSSKKYLVASIEKEITALDATKDNLYNKASAFAATVKDTATFNAEIKKDSTLDKKSTVNAGKNDRNLSNITGAREVIKWAFNEASIGTVSPVFSLENQYVVAILISEREEGTASVDDVRNEVTSKVLNQLKGDKIIEKLNALTGDLSAIATSYGPQALFGNAPAVTFTSNSIGSIGYDPLACGKAFGLKAGKRTQAFKGESAVVILELIKIEKAPEVADYNQYKTQKESQRAGSLDYQIDEAIKKIAEITDERYKFY